MSTTTQMGLAALASCFVLAACQDPDLQDCTCKILRNQADLNDNVLCQTKEDDKEICYDVQWDGTCSGGSWTKCKGPIKVSTFDACGCQSRNGAEPWDELWCGLNENENTCEPAKSSCHNELCVKCDLSECEPEPGETPDPNIVSNCRARGQWDCCMKRTKCEGACETENSIECFDCLHERENIDSCCEKVSAEEICDSWMPGCDLAHCESEDDQEACEMTERLLCCVSEHWECLACGTPDCQNECWESQRDECCTSLGIDPDNRFCKRADLHEMGVNVKFYDLDSGMTGYDEFDDFVDFDSLGTPYHEAVFERVYRSGWLWPGHPIFRTLKNVASLWTGHVLISQERWYCLDLLFNDQARLFLETQPETGEATMEEVALGEAHLLKVGRPALRVEHINAGNGDFRAAAILVYKPLFGGNRNCGFRPSFVGQFGWAPWPKSVFSRRGNDIVADAEL